MHSGVPWNDWIICAESKIMRVDRVLHDYVMNRDGVHVMIIHADQYTQEFKDAYPSLADLPYCIEVMTGNGVCRYVATFAEVQHVVELQSKGKGIIQRVWHGMEEQQAIKEGQEEYEYWQNKWRGAKVKKPGEKVTANDIDISLDDLNLDDVLGDIKL